MGLYPVNPNLFLIGASKCGSTFLHYLLAQHPDICMSTLKEPRLFNDDGYRERLDWYNSLFEHCGKQKYRGESSPTYSETTFFPHVPERLARYSPKARIIYIVREPFSRLESVYKQMMSSGHWAETRIYGDLMPVNYAAAVFDYPAYLEATKYWSHLQNYRKYFADSDIKVLFFEDLVSDPREVLSDVFSFLTISDNVLIDIESVEKNEGAKKQVFNPWLGRLRRVIPKSLRSAIPSKHRMRVRNGLGKLPRPRMSNTRLSNEQMGKIREMLTEEVQGLYEYCQIEGDPWNFLADKDAISADQ